MSNSHVTLLVLPQLQQGDFSFGRYPQLLRATQDDQFNRVPYDGSVQPVGVPHHASLYALGQEKPLVPLTHLIPKHVRNLRGLAAQARKEQAVMHVFGMLDLDSPFGSRRALEHTLRYLQSIPLPTYVHAGIWQCTPTEFNQGLAEIKSLEGDSLHLASIFPVDLLLTIPGERIKQYVDGITRRSSYRDPTHLSLPINEPLIFTTPPQSSNELFVITNHACHGLDSLVDTIQSNRHVSVHDLDSIETVNPSIQENLNRQRHTMIITNTHPGLLAYGGSLPEHPYLETYYHEGANDLLEVMLNPEFGYHTAPYETTVILKEPTNRAFDSLLAHYIKQIKEKELDYHCWLFDGHGLEGNYMVTNQPSFAFK